MTAGRIEVTARAIRQDRTQQLWQVDIVNEAGRLVATGQVRLQNVEPT
jgi:1,4-dihydroxy-2-naphthoyl-CoA hydrolase